MAYTLPKAAERAGRLRRELARILPRIVSLDVERVILFGSLARGAARSGSDLDLPVVRRTDRRFLDRLAEVYESARPRCAAGILIYTPEEMKEPGPSSPFLRRVLEEGEVLYEVETVWEHSVAELCRDASDFDEEFQELGRTAGSLDKYYIPARYPNGLPGGIPAEAFIECSLAQIIYQLRPAEDGPCRSSETGGPSPG